jgi:hypothetical protein
MTAEAKRQRLTFLKPAETTPETPPRNVDERDVITVGGLRCHRLSSWAKMVAWR